MSGMCIACGASGLAPLLPYRVEREADALFERRRIARCPACGLQQITPVPGPDELERYYSDAYRAGRRHVPRDIDRFPFDSTWFLSRGRAIRWFAEEIGQVRSILDIGAGFGHVLFGLSERYPAATLYATEADPRCRPFLERIGATLLDHSVDGTPAPDPGIRFDLIVMTHVLEHVPAPVAALRAARGLLHAGGALIIEVPNCPLRHAAIWEMAPHLSFFEGPSLSACLQRAGVAVRRMETSGPGYPHRTLASRVPQRVKDFLKRHLRRPPAAAVPVDAWSYRQPGRVPHAAFVQVGGDRFWLRTLGVSARADDPAG